MIFRSLMQKNRNLLTTFARRCTRDLIRNKSKDVESMRKIVDNTFGRYEVIEPWWVSERRTVPPYIPKPSYGESSTPIEDIQRPEIKDENQIECMRESCGLAREILKRVKQFIQPGVTTDTLDETVHNLIISNGAYPSPLNYRGFPKSICTSINNVACHGIPDNRPLQEGDIINVDITVYLNGYHGDCSDTFEVGEVDNEAKRLIKVTRQCLQNAIKICKPNENFNSIGQIIEETATQHGLNIVLAFAGHGIGTYFHGPPDIYHFANDYPGKMQPGMTFTIEPVLTQGSSMVEILEDGWTAVTVDQARTAQSEHTVLITEYGNEILTL